MKRWMTVWDFFHPLTHQWFGALVTNGVIPQEEYRLWVNELFLVHFIKNDVNQVSIDCFRYGAAASASLFSTFNVFRSGPEMVRLTFSFPLKKIYLQVICPGTGE